MENQSTAALNVPSRLKTENSPSTILARKRKVQETSLSAGTKQRNSPEISNNRQNFNLSVASCQTTPEIENNINRKLEFSDVSPHSSESFCGRSEKESTDTLSTTKQRVLNFQNLAKNEENQKTTESSSVPAVVNMNVGQPGDDSTVLLPSDQAIKENGDSPQDNTATNTLPGEDGDSNAIDDPEAATLRLVQQLMEEEQRNRLREWEEAQMQQVLAMSNADMSQLENSNADLAMAIRMQREEGGLTQDIANDLGDAMEEANIAEDDAAHGQMDADGNVLDVDNMDYDQLVNLGNQLGDVKTERWNAIADKHIGKLPTYKFDSTQKDIKDPMCCVCQCNFENEETLMKLPCGKYGWRKRNYFCD